jgi:hypothetical protein
MNKRVIVNVATGDFYCRLQERLRQSFMPSVDSVRLIHGPNGEFDTLSGHKHHTDHTGIDLITWTDCLPKGSRPHAESPYGFKVHAIKAAYEKGYTSILWLDSPAYAVKEDISPIFDKIEKEGYYAMSHIDPLENYVGNTALGEFGINREQLIGKNLPSGSCYGFDLSIALELFNKFYECEKEGLFRSEVVSESIIHRHDEAILALFLIRWSLPVFTFDPLFQSDSPECVIKSGGEMKL